MDDIITKIPLLLSFLLIGAIACLPLFKWDIKKFMQSSLGVKVVMWIPLYLLFACFALLGDYVRYTIIVVLVLLAIFEWYRQDKKGVAWFYVATLCLGFVAWDRVFETSGGTYWIIYCLSSVFSDVVAFFMGKFVGRHELPKVINKNKSYEGVIGQIIGGVLGIVLFGAVFGVHMQWVTGLIIGVASAGGDIFNSISKRQLKIKDWAQTIPGHGGVADRFSSLNVSMIVLALIIGMARM